MYFAKMSIIYKDQHNFWYNFGNIRALLVAYSATVSSTIYRSLSVDGRKRIKIKTMTENIAGTCVCSKCTEFNLRHKVQFHRFLSVLMWTVEDASIGTLRKQDGDGNESVKKAMGLMSKTTRLQVNHAFLFISLLSLHNYDVK